MTNEIKTDAERVVGQWDGRSADDLQSELERIFREMREDKARDRLVARQMPHREQLPEDLQSFNAYHIWGCDPEGRCVVGTRADRIEPVDKIRTYSLIDHH